MPSPEQAKRQAKLITPLGKDVLVIRAMDASEGLSQLFQYNIKASSDDLNINLDDLLGKMVTVDFQLPSGSSRYFSGIVSRFSMTGVQDNYACYEMTLRPWFWLLSQSADCKIFQHMNIPDIIKLVASDHGFTDIQDELSKTYPTWEYCVQYRESAFTFLSRLMEQEGIYYYFTHQSGKHKLVLSDGYGSHKAFPDYDEIPYFPESDNNQRKRDHLYQWLIDKSVHTGKYTLRDFDFTKPKANLEVKSNIDRSHDQASFEVYDYPGNYVEVSDGNNYVRNRMESTQMPYEISNSRGNARGLIPGHLFKLNGYPREDQNREYLIRTVQHQISMDSYDTSRGSGDDGFDYYCSASAMPSSETYRPDKNTPVVSIHGPQTAIVVGPAGEEIWTDKYGRIKVQFHWDRDGKSDENSSCWVRVSNNWAGKKWGAIFLPRIGQEVIIEFLEGNPNRPIVTGRVYNADCMPPYDLPSQKTQSGIKTHSSKGGASSNFNEIRFEDKKGHEELHLHAERQFTQSVEVNERHTVGNDLTKKVTRDEKIEIGRDHFKKIGKNHEQETGLNSKITIGSEHELSIGNKRTSNIGNSDTLNVGTTLTVEAGASITLKCGNSSVSITPAGITLDSPNITMNSMGTIKMKSSIISAKSSGTTTIKSGGLTTVSAGGILKLKGTQVINN